MTVLDRNLIERARASHILAVAQRYGAKLKRAGGGEFVGPCPVCGGSGPLSDRFAVNARKQIWNCRGCQQGGDVIALVRHVTGCDFVTAIEVLTGQEWPKPQIAERSARQPGAPSDYRAGALRIWREAQAISGTVAEIYLQEARGIDLAQLPDIDDVLRFHAACPFGEHGRLPCLLALIRDVISDTPMGIMRTALDADGNKIDRLGLGDKRGGAIKLWPHDQVLRRLIIGEGTETVAGAATRIIHDGAALRPAWAMIDSGNLKYFPPLSGIEDLVILVDNDLPDQHGRLAGQEAACACAQAWLDAGHFVELLTPRLPGADFNTIGRQHVGHQPRLRCHRHLVTISK